MSFNLMSTKNQRLEHSFKQNSNVSQLTLMGYTPLSTLLEQSSLTSMEVVRLQNSNQVEELTE